MKKHVKIICVTMMLLCATMLVSCFSAPPAPTVPDEMETSQRGTRADFSPTTHLSWYGLYEIGGVADADKQDGVYDVTADIDGIDEIAADEPRDEILKNIVKVSITTIPYPGIDYKNCLFDVEYKYNVLFEGEPGSMEEQAVKGIIKIGLPYDGAGEYFEIMTFDKAVYNVYDFEVRVVEDSISGQVIKKIIN